MPVWFRIWNLVRLATSCEISASRIPLWAAVKFWVWLLMTLTALCSRLMLAPNAPRVAATDWMAVSMVARAAVAAAALVIPAEPDPPANVAPLLKPKCVAAERVETMALPPAPETRAVNVSVPSAFWTALALVLAVVREAVRYA